MQTPIPPPDESAIALGASICLLWLVVLLWWIAAKSRVVADTVAWFHRTPHLVRILAVAAFTALAIHAGIKGGHGSTGFQPADSWGRGRPDSLASSSPEADTRSSSRQRSL